MGKGRDTGMGVGTTLVSASATGASRLQGKNIGHATSNNYCTILINSSVTHHRGVKE